MSFLENIIPEQGQPSRKERQERFQDGYRALAEIDIETQMLQEDAIDVKTGRSPRHFNWNEEGVREELEKNRQRKEEMQAALIEHAAQIQDLHALEELKSQIKKEREKK